MSAPERPSLGQREKALRDILGTNRDVVAAAARLLSLDRASTPALLDLLRAEKRIENRHALLYALTWHADVSTWNLMVDIVSDVDEAPRVRGQAAEALSYMFLDVRTDSREFDVAVSALRVALKDPSPEVRYCSVNALGSTGHPPLIPVLKEMLKDQAPVRGWIGTVGEEAFRALEALELAHGMRTKRGH